MNIVKENKINTNKINFIYLKIFDLFVDVGMFGINGFSQRVGIVVIGHALFKKVCFPGQSNG